MPGLGPGLILQTLGTVPEPRKGALAMGAVSGHDRPDPHVRAFSLPHTHPLFPAFFSLLAAPALVWVVARLLHIRTPGILRAQWAVQLMMSVPVVAFVASRLSLGWADSILATLCGLCLMSLIASDLLRYRLPDPLTGSLLAGALGLALMAPPPDWRAALATACVCAALLWGLRAGYRALRGQHGLGLGDVKLAAGIGALTGPFGAAPTLLLASLIALGWAALQKRPLSRHTRLPFGAALAAAAWLVWIWQRIPPTG